MSFWELALLAVGLSMDAFAVAICKGLSTQKVATKHSLLVGPYFGGFQALMPFVGFVLGMQFSSLITEIDHWIGFALLCLIGGNMICESRKPAESVNPSLSPRAMLPLAIATSIDALAVGITFAFLRIGCAFGLKFKSKAELAGGIVLIIMGCKILLEHTGWLNMLVERF